MPANPKDLPRRLAAGLKPAYLVSGDETLLVQEACDAILATARGQGFTERELIDGSGGVDWNATFGAAGNLSLFGDRRVLDVRLPRNRFDRKTSQALRDYLAKPLPDILLLIRTERLEPRQRSEAWFKAVEATGEAVLVWPLTPRELPGWLDERCRAAGVILKPDALTEFVERVEGNLLAAVQEIEKLKLAGLAMPVPADALREAVGDASRYDAFELLDAMCDGAAARVRKMLHVLRQEGRVRAPMLLGALNSQLRSALSIAAGKRPRLPQRRLQRLERLVKRVGAAGLERALNESAMLDMQAKGMLRGDEWASLERLLVRLAGGRSGLGSLVAEAPRLRLGGVA